MPFFRRRRAYESYSYQSSNSGYYGNSSYEYSSRYSDREKEREREREKYRERERESERYSRNNEETFTVASKCRAPAALPELTSYETIKADCLRRGCLWEDPTFRCDDSNIFFKTPPSCWPDIQWKRPGEIIYDPQLFVDGASTMDVNQGVLGDCWLLAAVAGLATEERLLRHVIPDNQSFARGEYAGIFRFNIWQYGRWVEVLVDDRLPTSKNRLIYMHAETRNEFWSALLEKAYAKLTGGCYELLCGGQTSEAMTDFTGGIVEKIELRNKAPEDLFRTMLKARQRASLMGCSIDADADSREQRLDNGLIIGHAYTVTDVRTIETRRFGRLAMVRVRNPWGDEHEWRGAWGDGSDEWNSLSRDERAELGLRFTHDGEFWMSYDDWVREFQRLELCYLGPATLGEAETFKLNNETFSGQLLEGVWRRNATAGGCRNYPKTFSTNPQYHIKLPSEAAEDDGLVTTIIAVMQKGGRKAKKTGGDNHPISFAIYEVDSDDIDSTLDRYWFRSHKVAATAPVFTNAREVADHYRLPPGNYVIIPSTFEPNQEAEFILRICSETKQTVREVDETAGKKEPSFDLSDSDDDAIFLTEIRRLFDHASGGDQEVTAYELRDIFNKIFSQEFKVDDFNVELCRSIVAVYDADYSGKLEFDDFKHLCEILKIVKKTFKLVDTEKVGWFSSFELRSILKQMGYYIPSLKGLRVSNQTLGAIVMRYSDKEGRVHFDDFMHCVVKLCAAFEHYKQNDPDEDGRCEFRKEEFIQLMVYS